MPFLWSGRSGCRRCCVVLLRRHVPVQSQSGPRRAASMIRSHYHGGKPVAQQSPETREPGRQQVQGKSPAALVLRPQLQGARVEKDRPCPHGIIRPEVDIEKARSHEALAMGLR